MGEVVGVRFAVEAGLLNAPLKWFELAFHGRRRTTASEPELLRQLRLLQSLLQRFLPFPRG